MDIYELLRKWNIALIDEDGKTEIAEQITVKRLQVLVEEVASRTRLLEKKARA